MLGQLAPVRVLSALRSSPVASKAKCGALQVRIPQPVHGTVSFVYNEACRQVGDEGAQQ